jgi:hypothetical protein
LQAESFQERLVNYSLTSMELVLAWGLVGAALYFYGRWRGTHGAGVDGVNLETVELGQEHSE